MKNNVSEWTLKVTYTGSAGSPWHAEVFILQHVEDDHGGTSRTIRRVDSLVHPTRDAAIQWLNEWGDEFGAWVKWLNDMTWVKTLEVREPS